MSVFSQLTMKRFHSAVNYMNLTVVGSPTIQDGVVSGFSGSDYVHTNSVFDTTQNFEIVVKINTGTLNSSLNLICRNAYGNTPGNPGLLFGIGSNKKITTFLDDTEGTRFVNGATGSTIFQNNTTYFIRFSQTGNTIKLESSSDNGLNWVTENTWTHQYKIRNSGQGLAFGGVGTQTYFPGSIDINNSYIKLNNTKYNFQFTMPLTVIGSPTIVDGVVSGFSDSNYIKVNNFNVNSADTWEVVTKIHTSLTNSGQCIFGNNVEWGTNVRINSENQLIFNISNTTTSADIGSITGTTVLSNNTDYYIKIKFTGTQYILLLSTNGTTWSNEGYINSSTKIINRGEWLFGMYSVSAWYFRGSIDLNYTYMILDGTKYILVLP